MEAAPGDVLLYHTRGRWYERVIVAATAQGALGADYVHAGLCVDADAAIEARPSGIVRVSIPWDDPHVVLVPTSEQCVPERVAAMLAWLGKQIGLPYSWASIGDCALRALWPHGWRLTRHGRYDCSSLCATALALAGYPLPASILTNLDTTAPNDLARALGLLPGYPLPGQAPYPPRG